MKLRIVILLLLLGGVVYLAFFAPSDLVETTLAMRSKMNNRQEAMDVIPPKTSTSTSATTLKPVQSTLLKDREDLLSSILNRKSASSLFQSHTWVVPVKKPVVSEVPIVPTAPPLPFRYLGKQKTGGEVKVFLAEGEKTWVVQDRTPIGSQYQVESIRPPKLTLIYLPLNTRQEIAIGLFE